MSFRLQNGDHQIIEYLAEYRMLTVSQLAGLFRKSEQIIRRHCRNLGSQGLIQKTSNEFGHNFGRPESLFGLTEQGVNVLRDKGLIGKDALYENVGPVSNRLSDHQLLLNWFTMRVCL